MNLTSESAASGNGRGRDDAVDETPRGEDGMRGFELRALVEDELEITAIVLSDSSESELEILIQIINETASSAIIPINGRQGLLASLATSLHEASDIRIIRVAVNTRTMPDQPPPSDERSDLTKRILPSMTLAQGRFISQADEDARYPNDAGRDTAEGRFRLTGNAIITGGTGAIGLRISRAMLQHGLEGLLMIDVNATGPESTEAIEALRRESPKAKIEPFSADVTDEEQIGQAVAAAAHRLGSVDMLVCLAGIVGCAHALDTPAAQWRRILDVNATGSFVCAQAAARQMVSQGRGGRIVLTASISGHRVNFPQPQAAYNVSKAAVVALKSSLAAEWARYGIAVNSISPGYMDTILNAGDGLEHARRTWCERNPSGRMGLPDELAGVVVMLLSRAGSYMNGADIVVDGGGLVF